MKKNNSSTNFGEKLGNIIKNDRLKLWIVPLEALAIVVVLLFLAFGIYLTDYSEATQAAKDAMDAGKTKGDYTVFDGGGEVGLVFYPGGKVEHSAYAPLMKALSEKGITCVLVEMPFKLAVFDINAYKDAVKQAPDVKNWYIGGHSLGGAAATMAANGADGVFEGVVLLAAYPTEKMEVPALSVTASLDGVMNAEKYEEGKTFFAENSKEVLIEGGNHAGFGSYGDQKGDEIATLPKEVQLKQTVDAIVEFVK